VLALKTASEVIREKVFNSVSSRASQMLREELELLGPTRLADVEAAQQAIVEAALRLEREGKIQIAREGGSDYV
jgi:flagellar motor switch protein FliG